MRWRAPQDASNRFRATMVADPELQVVLIAAIVVLAAYLVLLVVRLSRLQAQARASRAPTGPPMAAGETAPAHGGAAAAAPDTATAPVPNLAIPAAAPKPLPRRISPVHEKAAALAREGRDAATVARLCGISQSEAELVCWLARNRDSA